MIKNILFDLGGVVMPIDPEEAVKRFTALGLKNANRMLNSYTQSGYIGDLEEGKITDEEFRQILSKEVGKSLTWEECQWAWLGYRIEVPQRNLDMLKKLKAEGYRLILLSNTNAFMQQWAETDFDGNGGSISDYFDAMYRSYECKMMKPSDVFFIHVLRTEKIIPSETLFLDDGPRNVAAASEMGIFTYCPKNGEDWTEKIYDYLKE